MKAAQIGRKRQLFSSNLKSASLSEKNANNIERKTYYNVSKSLSLLSIIVSVAALCQQTEANPLLTSVPNKSDGGGGGSGELAAGQAPRNSLEAELASIVLQAPEVLESGTDNQVAKLIISRLMLDNLTASTLPNHGSPEVEGYDWDEFANGSDSFDPRDHLQQAPVAAMLSPEALRMRVILDYLQKYGPNIELTPGYPVLPSGKIATMKRTADRVNQIWQQKVLGNRAIQPYDFGKRPDSGVATNILRIGDGLSSSGSQIQPVGQYIKRPSAHRYDFGLGKRVASPSYPRFDFGLGKRAPNKIRYDFGLGK